MQLRNILALMALVSTPLFADDAPLERQIDKDIHTLAAERMEGRGLGTRGIDLAADYVEQRLQAAGLAPAFGREYRQRFPVKIGISAGPGNRLDGVAPGDWTPLGFSSPGSFSGQLVFVGYGIDAPPIGYRELEGIDLNGKIVLMLRYEPQEKDDASPFDGRKPSRWSALRYRVLQARQRGALAVVFVTGPLQDEGRDKVPPLTNDGPESPAGIPVLQVKTSVAQKWLTPVGIDLAAFQRAVDLDLKTRSQGTSLHVSGVVDVHPEFATTSNLAGVLPGRGTLANDVVVLGAHYDHLGYGGEGSMKPNVHAIHPGADDNASGTSGVLNAAKLIGDALKDAKDRRTIVFALFSGEERGLAGSTYLVDHPPVGISRVVAMVNLDMIGALREDKLIAFGTESAKEWPSLLERLVKGTNLALTESGDGYGPSDQTAFYAVKIPVIHFFTGAHERYHSPEDVADSVNVAGEARVVHYVADVVTALSRGEATPHYARAAAAPAMSGDSRGYGAYLGTVPDFSAMDQTAGGVLLSDVRPGAPAEKAGIRGKDRIIDIGGTRIENLYDMTYALQDHKPGDTVDVVVMRNGERKTLRATLSARGVVSPPPAKAPEGNAPAVNATPPATPALSAAAPHSVEPGADAKAPSFYENRPGKNFVIKAGTSYDKLAVGERHLTDIRQLTFGGENAEAYWSPDGRTLIFQAPPAAGGCDQQYSLDLGNGEVKMLSSGKGRTTCGYYRWPQGDRIVYATTEGGSPDCPPRPSHAEGYVWPVYPAYDIVEANVDGSNPKRITSTPGYDAEMTWCHRGGKMVFTSMRDGDIELYEMDEAGNVRRLTNAPGYDGGAFFNAECTEIVWRADHPTGQALDDYKALLAKNLVKPLHMELFLMNADGSNQRQITSNGAANFCPYFAPDGKRIIFASNVQSQGFEFDLWLVGKDGQGLERVTTAPGFDGFPVFSPDGRYVVWSSSRAKPDSHEMNLFIARWVE